MGVSLGVRISALCIVGALAIGTAAACGGGGEDSSNGSGSGGTTVSGGTSDGGQDGSGSGSGSGSGGSEGSDGGMPTWQPDDDTDGGSGGSAGSSGSNASGGNDSGGSTDSGGNDSGGKSPGQVNPPSWLRPGPRSPNTEQSPDPESVYDELGEKPGECSKTLAIIEAETEKDAPQWQVLRGLAHACLALQGQSDGKWDKAAEYFAATEGRLDTCKGLAAHTVLGDILRFHQQHPSTKVQLRSSAGSGGSDVCDFQITKVTAADGNGEVKAGERITIEVTGAPFSSEDLISIPELYVEGKPRTTGGLELVPGSQSGDRFSFTAEAPTLDSYPQTVDIKIVYGDEATLKDAITILDPESTNSSDPPPESSPGTSPGVSPSAVTSSSP